MTAMLGEANNSIQSHTPIGRDIQKQEFLVFGLGNEEYAIDIGNVSELRDYGKVTELVNAPNYIKGVINLRDVIVPIFDLRIRFGCDNPRYNEFTVTIILSVAGKSAGMVVDSVSNVVALTRDQLKPAPNISSLKENKYITGIGIADERMLILLDVEELIFNADFLSLEQLAV